MNIIIIIIIIMYITNINFGFFQAERGILSSHNAFLIELKGYSCKLSTCKIGAATIEQQGYYFLSVPPF